MAQISIDPIKFLSNIPEFSGDYGDLYTFLKLIDRVQPLLNEYNNISQLTFVDIIKSRLRGKAREIMEINCQVESLLEMKKILIINFGE